MAIIKKLLLLLFMNINFKLKDLASLLKSNIMISKKGVPHIVKSTPNKPHNFSICYFKSSDQFRVFYPYAVPNQGQQKWTFKTSEEILNFFNISLNERNSNACTDGD